MEFYIDIRIFVHIKLNFLETVKKTAVVTSVGN